jgi:hypothetical protein
VPSLGGPQLVAGSLLTAPGDCDDAEVGGMNGFGKGNRSTRREPAPKPLCPPQIPLARAGLEPGPPRWEASGLTASAMARPNYTQILQQNHLTEALMCMQEDATT